MRVLALIACLFGVPAFAQSQDCGAAEGLYTAVLDKHAAEGGALTGAEFAARSDGEKWYFVASKLLPQAIRLNFVLVDPDAVSAAWLKREAEVFLALDAAEPCYRDAAGQYARFAQIPADDWRAALRQRLEETE